MLDLLLEPGVGAHDWRASARGFSANHGAIEPFQHPALESFAVASPAEILIVTRERCADLTQVSGRARHIPHVSRERLEEIAAES
ncbi:MAG: hypothetical protein JWM95_3328, partial [Gemmatimonadetes bacterium]|nr:hypothetical protein [Gemmatimonadota bacterium]